jgi:FKBP-type peptidyl-prolyl cis-trans isomerase FklB
MIILTSSIAFGQSKKELEAEINKLKAVVEEMKKPKEILIDTEHKKVSYGLGVLMATNLKSQGGDSLDLESLNNGIKDALLGRPLKVSEQEAMAMVQPYMMKAMEKKTAKAKEEGVKFCNENKSKEGVVVTSSGLQYKVLTKGSGKMPTTSSNVTVHYTGKLINGTVFDSSVERGQPANFGVTQVIAGWTEALQLMHEGDKWMLVIPSDLAYGERGAGGQIPAHSTLIFEVELIKVD